MLRGIYFSLRRQEKRSEMLFQRQEKRSEMLFRRQEKRSEMLLRRMQNLNKKNDKYWRTQQQTLSKFLNDEHDRNMQRLEDQKKIFDNVIKCAAADKAEVILRFKQQDEYSNAILQCLQQVQNSLQELVQRKNENLEPENGIVQRSKEVNQFDKESDKKTKKIYKSSHTFV